MPDGGPEPVPYRAVTGAPFDPYTGPDPPHGARAGHDTGDLMAQEQQRRIDRVLAPDFLDGLDELPVAAVRDKREECRAEEEVLSYRRRLLQGRIDIVKAERARRDGTGDGGLIEALPAILADEHSSRRALTQARRSPVYVPGDPGADEEPEPLLGRLPDLSDEELEALVERLGTEEQEISRQRRELHERIDRLERQLIADYRDNPGDLDELLGGAGGSAGSR